MTDPVDQLLRDAGERWRATQPEPPEMRPIRPQRWGVLAGAAAAVVAVAGGALYVTSQQEPSTSYASLDAGGDPRVAVEGAQVEATGRVKRVWLETRFCAPAPVPAIAGADDCPLYVRVSGVDMDKLQNGRAHLRGTWRDGTLSVTWQGAPEQPSTPTAAAPSGPVDRQGRQEAENQVRSLMDDRTNGIYLAGFGSPMIEIELVVLTPEIKEKLRPIPAELLDIKPWLRPVR